MAKNKVYISSTYRDLKQHRKQVIEFFQKKTIKDNFDLVSMEGYVANDTAPALECLKDVEQCNIYILIIANRYGFIPPDPQNTGRLSITEMEYQTAASDPKKTILAFFADEGDPQFESDIEPDEDAAAEKKQKLIDFKTQVRESRLTHPEPFISSFHLALQIAESLMRKSFITYKLEDSRKYCCDRVQQFSRYLQVRNKGSFNTIVIYGDRSELGLNLINRFSIFTLNLLESDIVPPLTFEEFLISEDYEQCRTDLLVYIYFKLFNTYNLDDPSIPSFLAACRNLNKPLILVINCEADMFEEMQMLFLQKFLEEFYEASLIPENPRVFLFLNFENNKQQATINQKIKDLQQSLPNQAKYLSVLPPLQSLSAAFIRNWLLSYVSPDQGRVEELMEYSFGNLPTPITMRVAEKGIQQFIQQVNNQDQNVLNIIN